MSALERPPVGPRSGPRVSRAPHDAELSDVRRGATSPQGSFSLGVFRLSHPKVFAFYGGCFIALLVLPLVLVSASLLSGNLTERDVQSLVSRLVKKRRGEKPPEAKLSSIDFLACETHGVASAAAGLLPTQQSCECKEEKHALQEGSRPSDEMWGRYFDNFLFVAYSDSLFYHSRLKDLLSTWGTLIDKQSLIIVGDREAQVEERQVIATGCQAHSHWEGACCKYASALYFVYERMREDPLLEAAYLTDDDSYVRPQALAQAILQMAQRYEAEHKPAMFGIMGCATALCHGACAGAGYGINRRGVFATVDPNSTNNVTMKVFVADMMKACKKCERWADQALSNLAETRQVELVNYDPDNIYHGWRMSQAAFKNSLVLKEHGPALMYHYVAGGAQLNYMHSLFRPDRNWNRCPLLSAERQKEVESDGGMCASFSGRTCCSSAHDTKNMPWERAR